MDSVRAKWWIKDLLGKSVGGWSLVECVGLGKSAIIFKAIEGSRDAAVKIYDPELVDRFGPNVVAGRIERQLALRDKDHPNLIKIVDGGRCANTGLYYLVMALLEYPSLATRIEDVPRDRIWPLISQVAHAARFLEDLGLVHRDIKPDNIAISSDFQHAVLLDLGVLRPVGDGGLTDEEQRTFIGTLQYSSPEFLLRKEEDSLDGWRALTFYQLGAVLHDMIMKKRIFSEFANPYAHLVQAVQYDLPLIDAKDVPPELVLTARTCLAKDPRLRVRLIDWRDFEPRESLPSTGMDAKERVRKRLAVARNSASIIPDVEMERAQQQLRRTLDDVQTKLQEGIRRECIGNDLFPPGACQQL